MIGLESPSKRTADLEKAMDDADASGEVEQRFLFGPRQQTCREEVAVRCATSRGD
jgi:hypothetical protein